MTLLGNRARTKAYEDAPANQDGRQDGKLDGRASNGRKVSLSPRNSGAQQSSATVPPEEALRTLRTRLEAQLNGGAGTGDGQWDSDTDPEARFLAKSVERRLNQVNAALERIEEGKYGICADCEKPIEQDRLVLQPMSTRCTRCQSVAEWRGAAY